jgi:hypothetical protein
LAACSAIARSGERCKGVAIDGSGLCYAHHPDHVESRRRAARRGGKRGGRGRPVAEISELKRRFEELAEDVLDGKLDRGDAAVVGQLLNYAVRAVAVGLKAREQQELEERLEQLEALLDEKDGARGWG